MARPRKFSDDTVMVAVRIPKTLADQIPSASVSGARSDYIREAIAEKVAREK